MKLRALLAGLAVLPVAAGPAAAAEPRGTLDFQRVFDTSRGVYVEGSVSHVEVRDSAGRVVLARRSGPAVRFRVTAPLPTGRYRVTSFERPCEGTCAVLDPPAGACSKRVAVLARGRTAVRVTARAGRPCTMKAKARPALFPPAGRITEVRRFLRARRGIESWALLDSHGRVHGFASRRDYVSASVVKAMLLVAYLRKIGNRAPNRVERSMLGPMITASDNGRASAVYGRVGGGALRALAERAEMRRFVDVGLWTGARINALDQARFFRVFDRLTPVRSRGYARGLLSSIVRHQRWGFSRFSLAAGFDTFFKGGWRGTSRGSLVHEAALFERGPLRISMAVLTDDNPSHGYGTATLRGVAQRIFGSDGASAVTAGTEEGGLVDVHRYGPGIEVDLVYRTRHNLTGRPLPGYCENRGLLLKRPARDLGRVQRHLRRRGLGLLVLDAYRPARASRALVRWARRSGRPELVGTYIARRSRHNTGTAADLTLVRFRDGRPLDMGTGYDDLSTRAHTGNAGGRALRNRLTLKRAMERFGYRAYWREWWHFEHRERSSAYLDLPLGC